MDVELEQPAPPRGRLRSAWRRLRDAHFHDYSPAAFRMWLAIVMAGSAAFGLALWSVMGAGAGTAWPVAGGLALVAAAAWFPVEIPRSKYSIGASDAFIFTMLALLGPAPAVLAAGVEGAVGAWRSTRRLTSRVSTPMAAMAALTVGAQAFQTVWSGLAALGWDVPVAKLAALPLTALVPFTLSSLALMSTVTLKRRRWPEIGAWAADSAWIAALSLAAAVLAGVVQLATVGRGPVPLAIVGVATLLLVLLLRESFRRSEAEHRAQDERIRLAEHEAVLSQQRFAGAFTSAAIGMAIVDATGRILRVNEALCVILQRTEASLDGVPFTDVLHEDDLALFERQGWTSQAPRAGASPPLELRCRTPEGPPRWVALHSSRFASADGQVDGLIHQLHDITTRREAEQRLHHNAYHDSLTNLANRAAFHERVSAALEAYHAGTLPRFAVVFLDLDRFKVVNDSLGHLAGNELLREVASRLSHSVRRNDLVARLGGDEFAVLLHDLDETRSCVRLTERMLADLSRPFVIEGQEVVPGASAGIATCDHGARTVDDLLRDADLAMYEAKEGGAGRVVVFDETMHTRIADKLALETDLRHAIAADELSLAFQPVFGLDPQDLVGFEALARWNHPSRGPISPAVFVTLAEEAGHIEALTEWALNKALAFLADWRREAPQARDVRMQVNISGRDLAQPRFNDRVMDALQRHAVPASVLTLEITESILMQRIETAGQALARLRATGVKLAIDDFGTGYSSLAYLSKLPVDVIKIDRSFVWAMRPTGEDLEIVRAITGLGHALGKKIVAEGIETQEQHDLLRTLGVDNGQGFLMGRPMAPEQARALLLAQRSPSPCTAACC